MFRQNEIIINSELFTVAMCVCPVHTHTHTHTPTLAPKANCGWLVGWVDGSVDFVWVEVVCLCMSEATLWVRCDPNRARARAFAPTYAHRIEILIDGSGERERERASQPASVLGSGDGVSAPGLARM